MKKLVLTILCLTFFFGVASAQKTQGAFTIWVYNSTSGCTPLGSLITANNQLAANTVYFVKVKSSSSPAAIRIQNADGFDAGLYGWCPFQLRADPTSAAGDTGSVNDWTITFPIRTFSGVDFATPVFMKIQHTFDGVNWSGTQYVTFPY
jgi:hypothetical protein